MTTAELARRLGVSQPRVTEEERAELIPNWITLRSELNEAEQVNIPEAEDWAFARRRDALEQRFLARLHQKMFGHVWRWAGQFRTTARNIGVDTYRIPSDLLLLLDECRYWIDNGSWKPDQIALRFHHRLVLVHPFPNGNGRRSAADSDEPVEIHMKPHQPARSRRDPPAVHRSTARRRPP